MVFFLWKIPCFLCHDFIYCFVFFLNRLRFEEWFRFTTKCVEVQKLFRYLLPPHKHRLPALPTFPSAMWSWGWELDVFEGLLFHMLQHPLANTISLSFAHVAECLSSLLLLCWAVFWQHTQLYVYSVDGHLGCHQCLVIMNKNLFLHIFFPWKKRMRIARSQGNSKFDFSCVY